jgi:hypothetical protein
MSRFCHLQELFSIESGRTSWHSLPTTTYTERFSNNMPRVSPHLFTSTNCFVLFYVLVVSELSQNFPVALFVIVENEKTYGLTLRRKVAELQPSFSCASNCT